MVRLGASACTVLLTKLCAGSCGVFGQRLDYECAN
jgi:hypothetical protein